MMVIHWLMAKYKGFYFSLHLLTNNCIANPGVRETEIFFGTTLIPIQIRIRLSLLKLLRISAFLVRNFYLKMSNPVSDPDMYRQALDARPDLVG
jgi:hypothetical protein